MKGPGLRIDHDIRRVWRCAKCHTERHTPGRVTLVRCHFCQDHPLMTLHEPRRSERGLVQPPDMVIELHPDDVDAPAFVPAHLRDPEELDTDATEQLPAEETTTTTEAEAATVEQEPPSEEAETSSDEPADVADRSPRPQKSRRKKGRRKKKRGDGPQSTGGNAS